MKIYILDKDYYDLKKYENLFFSIKSKAEIKLFTNSVSLWNAYLERNADIVFVEKESYDSLALIGKIRNENPNQVIVLVTENDVLTPEIIGLKVNGIIKKPLREENLNKVLLKIKHPLISKIFNVI